MGDQPCEQDCAIFGQLAQINWQLPCSVSIMFKGGRGEGGRGGEGAKERIERERGGGEYVMYTGERERER